MASNGKRTLIADAKRVPLESVITTPELSRRRRRTQNHEIENRALVSLAEEMANRPGNLLQKVVEVALDLCRGQSAGISILEEHEGHPAFRWHAVAGRWAGYQGAVVPREASPCGTVLDRNAPQLMTRPERHFQLPRNFTPGIEEVLLVPIEASGKPIGTLWAIAHDGNRQFDEEDARVIRSLGGFASSACQLLESLDALKTQMAQLRESEQRFRQYLDSMPAAIYTTDAEGLLAYFNPIAADTVGRKPELGSDQWCLSWRMLHGDGTTLPRDECPMAISLQERRAIRGERLILERPDGGRTWVLPHPTPLFDESGKLTGGLNLVLDITSLKEAEDLLVEQRDLLEMIALGRPLDECIATFCSAVTKLVPETRARILLADRDAVLPDRPMAFPDLARDPRWERVWKDVRGAGGASGGTITPIVCQEGPPLGLVALYFASDRMPTDREMRISEFGARIACLALERDKSSNALREADRRKDAFLVRLPLASAAADAPSKSEPGSRPEPRRILVVDDNEDAAQSLSLLLEAVGHSVRVAFDGDEALRVAAQFEPELVFLDIGMPKTNGYDAARRMRAESWGKSIHLVALTGWGQDGDRLRAEEAGFNAHLVKPVSPEAVTKQIAALCRP